MKYIIEFTEETTDKLDAKRGDLPMPTFLKQVLKLKSIEVVDGAHWLNEDLYELDRELAII